jgi:hypothetical protein
MNNGHALNVSGARLPVIPALEIHSKLHQKKEIFFQAITEKIADLMIKLSKADIDKMYE